MRARRNGWNMMGIESPSLYVKQLKITTEMEVMPHESWAQLPIKDIQLTLEASFCDSGGSKLIG